MDETNRRADATAMPLSARSATNVLVLDILGEVFALLREMELPSSLWRSLDAGRVSPDVDFRFAICAAYGTPDWPAVTTLGRLAPVLIITTAYQRSEMEEALRRDVVGYLDAGMERSVLERAVRGVVVRDELAFPRDALSAYFRAQREAARTQADNTILTQRQNQIVSLIATGATDKEIASRLGIAPTTAQKHVTNILQRLQVPNRAAAVAVVSAPRRAW